MELPSYTRVMRASGHERSRAGKNRLPSHLDAGSRFLEGSEAPEKKLG